MLVFSSLGQRCSGINYPDRSPILRSLLVLTRGGRVGGGSDGGEGG
jgi:hypothetical protein